MKTKKMKYWGGPRAARTSTQSAFKTPQDAEYGEPRVVTRAIRRIPTETRTLILPTGRLRRRAEPTNLKVVRDPATGRFAKNPAYVPPPSPAEVRRRAAALEGWF